MAKIGAVGFTAIDKVFRIHSFESIPPPFMNNIRESIPASKIPATFGTEWDMEKIETLLQQEGMGTPAIGYSGRAPNIGYQVARLGGEVELITEVGSDFYHPQPTKKDSYATHLANAGINSIPFRVDVPPDLWNNPSDLESHLHSQYGRDLSTHGLLLVPTSITSSVIALSDSSGRDIFFFNDTSTPSRIAKSRPVPDLLLDSLDAVIISSGENQFNLNVARRAHNKGLRIFFDIGLFHPNADYYREMVSTCNVIFGNNREINEICKAFGVKENEPQEILSRTEQAGRPEHIILEEKTTGTVTVFSRGHREPEVIGPIRIQGNGTSVGVCDAIAGGFIFAFMNYYPIEVCVRMGLIAGGAVWEKQTVQEAMIGLDEMKARYKQIFLDEIPPP